MGRLGERISRSALLSAIAVVVVSALVAWVGMAGPRLAKTEGHRAIPAWEMLETGEIYPTRMFGTVYVNKPPGLPWAIALSSMVFGENEFAARVPSALGHTLLALLALVFARSWFGPVGGLAGGLATALLPGFIAPARSADIESLLMLSAAMVAFPMVSLLAVRPEWSKREPRVLACMIFAGMVCGALLKGPVLMLVVMAVWIGPLFISIRKGGPRASKWCLWAPLIGFGIGSGVLYLMYASLPGDETVVRQSFTGFMWSAEELAGIALLAPGALALALPMSIALVFPFGKDAVAEQQGTLGERGVLIARICAASVLAGLGVGMLYGLSNPRYALPVLVLVGPLVGYVVAGPRNGFTHERRKIARTLLLGSGLAWVVILTGAALWWAFAVRPDDRDRGYDSAVRIVEAMSERGIGAGGPIEVLGGQAVFSKPEVLWYMRELGGQQGIEMELVWAKEMVRDVEVPAAGVVVVLKRNEWERYAEEGRSGSLEVIAEVYPDTKGFVVVRSRGRADVDSGEPLDASTE